ncbi:MAG: DUF1329 domain-containing protein [Bacteroidota bacterium]
MKLSQFSLTVAVLSWSVLSGEAQAKLNPAELARLGADLTVVGAEKAGNADGTIPAYEGGLAKTAAGDPFAGEKPLFTITAANAEQYKDKLSAGDLALLKRYATFAMPVYPSHRTATFPAAMLDQVKAQAANTELDGSGIKGFLPGPYYPFPIPRNGLEAIWNHLLRYTGGSVEDRIDTFVVRPNGDYSTFGARIRRYNYSHLDEPRPSEHLRNMVFYTNPASLEGTVYLVQDPVDTVGNSRAAWIYNAGQRRVRRAPDLNYDMITDGGEGVYFVDQIDAYNGAPDRFDWKLVGKREMYVPYNTYKMASKSLKYADIIRPNTVNPDNMRYELHRVWVVEGTLKDGAKHQFGKRTFYIDEDTWHILGEDAYDTRGGLWRVALHGVEQVPGADTAYYTFNLYHDLNSGAYAIWGLSNESSVPRTFGKKGKTIDFEPDALRRQGLK